MFGSEILEIIIGLVFVYWILSLLCSGINETISSIVSMRAKDLEKAIRYLLDDPKGIEFAKSVYSHGLIKSLSKEGKKPSYIRSDTFALVLLDTIAPASLSSQLKKIEEIRESVNKIQNARLRQTLLVLIEEAGSELGKLRENIENWFNNAMQRVSGWYKRKVQTIIAILALLLGVALNADTFMIAKYLINDAPMRAAIVEAAEEAVKQSIPLDQGILEKEGKIAVAPEGTSEASIQKVRYVQKELWKLPLPLGWYEVPKGFADWIMKLLGILFTAIAVSLGAPFWFDFLDKILKVRLAQSGKRPENSSQQS